LDNLLEKGKRIGHAKNGHLLSMGKLEAQCILGQQQYMAD
jgi:hypothetical protein